MLDPEVNREVVRLRHLLLKMAELAEHVEQTGSFQGGLNNSIIRYNTIVQRLEEVGACPRSLFPALDDNSTAATLGAEATLLAEYLQDVTGESEKRGGGSVPDINTIVSLAPFLGRDELGIMVRERFRGRWRERGRSQNGENNQERDEGERSRMDIKSLVHLAPHIDSEDLADLVRAYLSREKGFDPKYLVHLAPHMNSKDLSAIIRDCMPDWFGASGESAEEGETRSEPLTPTLSPEPGRGSEGATGPAAAAHPAQTAVPGPAAQPVPAPAPAPAAQPFSNEQFYSAERRAIGEDSELANETPL